MNNAALLNINKINPKMTPLANKSSPARLKTIKIIVEIGIARFWLIKLKARLFM
jgi:hypothetical protein